MVMEQARKEKALVPAEARDLAAVEKGKVAVKDATGDKARVVARDKAKVQPPAKDKAVDGNSRLLLKMKKGV